MGKQTKKLIVGTAIAAAAGYVAGILTAPKSGKETRKDIATAANKAKTEVEKQLKKLHSELAGLIDRGKIQMTEVKQNTKSGLVEALAKAQFAKEKARELLSALHDGDTDDKDLQKAVKEAKQAVEHLKKYLTTHDSAQESK